MSQKLRDELHKLANIQVTKLQKEAAEGDAPAPVGAAPVTRELSKGEIIKFMLLYGGGGAALGAGLGAVTGGMDNVGAIAGGGIAGLAGGSLLGVMALNARRIREHSAAREQGAGTELMNRSWNLGEGGLLESTPSAAALGAGTGVAAQMLSSGSLNKVPGAVTKIPGALKKVPKLFKMPNFKKFKMPSFSKPNLKPGNLQMGANAGKYVKGGSKGSINGASIYKNLQGGAKKAALFALMGIGAQIGINEYRGQARHKRLSKLPPE